MSDSLLQLSDVRAAADRIEGRVADTHDRSFLAVDAKSARVEVEVELADPLLRAAMISNLFAEGFHRRSPSPSHIINEGGPA